MASSKSPVIWSTTASVNGNVDSTINWVEGMPRRDVNASARAQMAAVKAWINDTAAGIRTAGTASAYTVSTSQGLDGAAIPTGASLLVQVHATNADQPTLSVNGGTASEIRWIDGENLVAGSMIAEGFYTLRKDASGWLLISSNTDRFIGARLFKASAQTIPTATDTVVTWQTTAFDTASLFNGTNRLTVPTGYGLSYVDVRAQINFFSAPAGLNKTAKIFITRNGSGFFCGQDKLYYNGGTTLNCSALLNVSGGDYFTVGVNHDDSASVDISGNSTCFFSIRIF